MMILLYEPPACQKRCSLVRTRPPIRLSSYTFFFVINKCVCVFLGGDRRSRCPWVLGDLSLYVQEEDCVEAVSALYTT